MSKHKNTLFNLASDGIFVEYNKVEPSKSKFLVSDDVLADLKDSKITPDYFLNLIFCPWTGMKDKNGNKIYLGDIIKYHVNFSAEMGDTETHTGEVYFDESVGCYLFDRSFEMSFLDVNYSKKTLEIVGSIYNE